MSSTGKPLVSIVIPAYQCANTLQRAVNSVLIQEFQDFEIVIVDDGSTDDTPAVAKELRDLDSRISLIHQENRGPADARNTAISRARGDLIAFLDADDEWLPGKLIKQVQVMHERCEVGLVFCDGRQENQSAGSCQLFSRANARVLSQLVFRPLSPWSELKIVANDDLDRLLYNKNFIHLSSVVVRKGKLHEVGFFNPSRFGTEDVDLWVRLASQTTFCYWDDVRTVHYRTSENLSNVSERWLLEQVRYHEMCLNAREYYHLHDLAQKKLKAAYRSLIVHYGLNNQPKEALAACRRSLLLVFDPRVPMYTALSFLGPSAFRVAKRVVEWRKGCCV